MLAAIGHYVALSTLSIFSFGIGAVVLNVAYQLVRLHFPIPVHALTTPLRSSLPETQHDLR